jgi:hypothetical protein
MKPIIGGQALDAGKYVIWYESENSIKAKLELVYQYDIKGTGSWALGQEPENTWNYYKLWLNNCTFTDIQDNPAKDYILNAYANKLIDGCGVNRFLPDEPLTRAQAVTMIVRWLGITAESAPAYGFDDCVGSWAQTYLETARKYHIIIGIGNNRFDPNRPITREEISFIINRAMIYQSNNSSTSVISVTPVSHSLSYSEDAVFDAYSILTGLSDGPYRWQGSITRAEATVLLSQLPSKNSSTNGAPAITFT